MALETVMEEEELEEDAEGTGASFYSTVSS